MEKKQSRIAAEGIARVAVNGNVAVVAEVNSETDFVAKNETFQEFVQTVADTALASGLMVVQMERISTLFLLQTDLASFL